MRTLTVASLTVALFMQTTSANEILDRSWRCNPGTILFSLPEQTLELNVTETDGHIRFDGMLIDTDYYLNGLQRQWSWDDNYLITLSPELSAAYYDFTDVAEGETTEPSSIFTCKKIDSLVKTVHVDMPDLPDTIGAKKWHEVANWRKLKRGMNYAQVSNILGEPDKISGGEVATWNYKGKTGYASVTFMSDELYSWNEPSFL